LPQAQAQYAHPGSGNKHAIFVFQPTDGIPTTADTREHGQLHFSNTIWDVIIAYAPSQTEMAAITHCHCCACWMKKSYRQ
jgi:hypothetical protein